MNFSKGAPEGGLQFPLTKEALEALPPSKLASPRVGNPHGLEAIHADLIENIDAYALEVLAVRSMVARGEMPWDFLEKYWPEQWGPFDRKAGTILTEYAGLSFDDPMGLANVVHMDSPNDLPKYAIRYLLETGAKPKQANPGCIDFLEYVPETERKLAEAVERNLVKAFEAKYYYGVARPEEYYGTNITHYPEGCPTHPSFPAGHSGAASALSVLLSRFDCNETQIQDIRFAAYAWGQFRTFAGVHYAPDNIAGLKLGGLL